MSYILDALKKSEVERQRSAEQDNTNDGIRPPQPPKYAASKRTPYIVGVAFLLAVLTTIYFLTGTKEHITGSNDIAEQAVVQKTAAIIEGSNISSKNNDLQEKEPAPKTFKALPFFWEKPAAYRQGIDPFSVNIHVYAANPSQRILFINNREYRAGEQTQQGPRVESIEPQGVILSYQGEYFKLPRPR